MKIIFTLIICFLFSVSIYSQGKDDPRDIAARSLETFKKMINEQNYRTMGFESLDEVSQAELEEPLMVYIIQLDQLQRYEKGSDPNRLLVEEGKYIYPVSVRDNVKSSLSVSRVRQEWKATNFGSPNYTKMLSKYKSDNSFIVNVLALNLSFVGSRDGDKLTLIPVMDFDEYEFKAGQRMPAEAVLEKISVAAKEHDDLPR